MAGVRAMDQALDLVRMPAFAQAMHSMPVPDDVVDVIRIAAGSPEAGRDEEARSGHSQEVLVEAARFFLVQVLFAPGGDAYRVLGISPGAPREVAREHMRLLLEWLHPDRNHAWDSVYAGKVLKAWREVSSSTESKEGVGAVTENVHIQRRRRDWGRGNFATARIPWKENGDSILWSLSLQDYLRRFRPLTLLLTTIAVFVFFSVIIKLASEPNSRDSSESFLDETNRASSSLDQINTILKMAPQR